MARHTAQEAKSSAKHAVENVKHELKGAEHAAQDAMTSFKDILVRNPVASVGIAAGVGLVLGLFVFRSRS